MAADIKNYLKEKEIRQKNQGDYQKKLLKSRLRIVYRVLLVVAVVGAVLALVAVQAKRHIYTGYETVSSVNRETSSDATDVRLKNGILTYSKDGAHCTDAKGNVKWNQTYVIQDVQLALCRDVAAIGSYNGREIYVQNAEKQLGTITTTMPIRNLTVAETGRVTAVLADTDVTWLKTYETDGTESYTGQAHMNDGGYPISICLSPDGELLAISYLYVDAGVVKTSVVFYNFGPVGENQSDYLVSAYSYSDLIVPKVQFMNNDTAFAVGDSRLMIYTGSQKPVTAGEYLYEEEIQSVFYSDKYVGLVFLSDQTESKYRIDVYNTSAAKVGSYYFDVDYTDIFFEDDDMVIYNDAECQIFMTDGVEKYHGNFNKSVRLMLPAGGSYKYYLVTENTIDTIQLK
mgnify:FL=1